MYNNRNVFSNSSIKHVDSRYATDRHEFELNAKLWSELFEQMGPSLKSSLSPSLNGEIKTRSLDQIAKNIESRKNNDSSTPVADYETTTFYKAAYKYFRDIFLLTQHS
jgi:hypothetical protein